MVNNSVTSTFSQVLSTSKLFSSLFDSSLSLQNQLFIKLFELEEFACGWIKNVLKALPKFDALSVTQEKF